MVPMSDSSRTISRRRVLAAGSAVTAGAWVAPSVLALDRVSAATGSCGVAPLRFDWSSIAPTTALPPSITANDGTVVSFALTGDTNLLLAAFDGDVRTGTRGARTDYLGLGLTGATGGQGVTLTMTFSKPVQACFEMLDIDRAEGVWEDSVTVSASVGGANVPISAADFLPMGPSVAVVANDTIRGVGSEGNSSDLANVDFNSPAEVDEIQLDYYDLTGFTGGQVIGIHDLRWC